MSVAIYYHPEAYTTQGPKLMGRNAAGESFLRGFFSQSNSSEFWVQVEHLEHGRHFQETFRTFKRPEPVRVIGKNNLANLAKAGAVYFPGPGIGEHALHRAVFGHGAWSLCGVTHTTSSARAMDALASLVTAPVQPWDAVICTSAAVKKNVTRVMQAQVDYLKDRLGVTKLVLPQLPVIPLGIHTQDFVFTNAQRSKARAAMGVDEDTLVVLFMGRLSFHAKAHPLAMYQALEAATLASGKKVMLLECGVHANDSIAAAFSQAAALACPNVRVLHWAGREAGKATFAWAGADVFCSLSDNIQEAFGITPLEAMAAGLPVVVSDWDGYKDTVRDGIDGFRIPTYTPRPGLGVEHAYRHAIEIDTYDMYCGHTSTLTAVDVQAAAIAFERLFKSPELRRQLGEAGRHRAAEVYDWKVIIPRYEALWAQLSEIRTTQGQNRKSQPHPWPARMDPFYAFADYPTGVLKEQTLLALVDENAQAASARIHAYGQLAMVSFAKEVLPSQNEIEIVLAAAESGPLSASALVEKIPQLRRHFVLRSLTWFLKMGILKVMP